MPDVRLGQTARIVSTLMAGVALGLGATYVAANRPPPFGAVRSGPWRAWPGAGTAEIDPYSRAVFARRGQIPLAASSGLRFLATTDGTGAPLDARCAYAVGGSTATAQFWTLSLLDRRGFVEPNPAGRFGFTSSEIVRDAEGGFVIVIDGPARPGNWLPVTGAGPFQLLLSFYDTPLSTALQTGGTVPGLPSITRGACR